MMSELSTLMHGREWDGQDVSGWLMSEKLDGFRAYWDGSAMWTRGGNQIAVPESWRAELPDKIHLDGEIYAGPGGVDIVRDAVRFGRFHPAVRFHVFDIPTIRASFADRYERLLSLVPCGAHIRPVIHRSCRSIDHAVTFMEEIQAAGGEGVVLRDPSNLYKPGRTPEILKLKDVSLYCLTM